MKTLLYAIVVVAIVATISPSLFAQWPSHPTPGVPKLPNGQPDLNGPTPRTADGHPDLSGIWQNGGGGGGGGGRGQRGAAGNAAAGAPPAGAPPAGPGAPPAPPNDGQRGAPGAGAPGGQGQRGGGQRGGQGLPPDGVPNAAFFNIGTGFRDGLPLQPWAQDLVKKRMADNSKDNPDAHCLPMGFMQFHMHPQPRKIVQTPGLTLIMYEANYGLRQIYTDGRPLPNKNDLQPWWYGYSVGKWEGDTLVVETTGFIDDIWLDVNGNPLTEQGRVVEKFRRPNFGTLEVEVMIDDSKAYSRPFTVKLTQRIMLNSELIEFICQDKDAAHYVGAGGK
jgi:hypothetical protein